MSWNTEKEEKLRKLWNEGRTGSEIAHILGNTTRNAVIGKAHRLNLPARTVSKRSIPKANKEKVQVSETKNQKLGRKAKFRALLLDENFEPENPTKLEDLTDELCKWPIGEKMEPATFFCGRKSFNERNRTYTPYSSSHCPRSL